MKRWILAAGLVAAAAVQPAVAEDFADADTWIEKLGNAARVHELGEAARRLAERGYAVERSGRFLTGPSVSLTGPQVPESDDDGWSAETADPDAGSAKEEHSASPHNRYAGVPGQPVGTASDDEDDDDDDEKDDRR
jgi:hypothetical protein